MISTIFTFALFGVSLSIIGYVIYCYRTAPDTIVAKSSLDPNDKPEYRQATVMDRLSYATKKSSALFIQLATTCIVALSNAILNMADFLGAPEVREFVQQNLTPQVASTVIVVLVGITVWARFRKE